MPYVEKLCTRCNSVASVICNNSDYYRCSNPLCAKLFRLGVTENMGVFNYEEYND